MDLSKKPRIILTLHICEKSILISRGSSQMSSFCPSCKMFYLTYSDVHLICLYSWFQCHIYGTILYNDQNHKCIHFQNILIVLMVLHILFAQFCKLKTVFSVSTDIFQLEYPLLTPKQFPIFWLDPLLIPEPIFWYLHHKICDFFLHLWNDLWEIF